MVTINSPGHHLHNINGRVFFKHPDGRVGVQVVHSDKKGHVSNVTLKPSQFVKGVVDLEKEDKTKSSTVKESTQIDELDTKNLQKYIDRATADHGHQNMARRNTTGDAQKEYARKEALRKKGISRAIARVYPQNESRGEYQNSVDSYGSRAAKLLHHSWAQHDASKEKSKAGDKEGAAKLSASGSRAHKLFLKARDRHLKNPEHAEKYRNKIMSGASDYYKSKKPGEYTGDSFDPTLTNDAPMLGEAKSAAVRMQRALQRAREQQERETRLGQQVMAKAKADVEKDKRKNIGEQTMKTLASIIEEVNQKIHPNALHVKQVSVDGKTKYHVHAVGKNFAHGIKVGEHLSDSELDDFSEMGGKIKHVK
jgi:hypothetical protein